MSVPAEIRPPLEVAFVISQLGLGGSERRFTDALLRMRRDARVRVRALVLESGGENEHELREGGVPVSVPNGGPRRLARLRALWNLLARGRPDALVAFDMIAAAYARPVASAVGVPVTLVSFNATVIESAHLRAAERALRHLTDVYLCNSEPAVRMLRDRYHVPGDRLQLLPNGFDPSRMKRRQRRVGSLRKELGIPEQCRLVGAVGKLDALKDPITFIHAAALVRREHPSAAFCYIGSGPLLEAARAAVADHRMGDVVHLVPRRPDAPWLSREFDVGVLSSASEGLPNALLEYMYWGKPCVVTDVGECGRVIEDGVTGYVVPPRDPAALAGAIGRLLADPERAGAMGEAGRRRLEREYGIDRYVERLIGIIGQARAAKRGASRAAGEGE